MFTSPIILTVSQLTHAVKLHLEKQFPKVVVRGEISNFKRQASNHLYFTLKDSRAQVQCAMFQADARHLRVDPANGDQVEIVGELNVYPPRGNYQIIVRSLQLAGVGELLKLLNDRKEKFLKMGWFEASCKKKLPTFPKTIGVITSPTGAVISDILQILNRRAHGFRVLLNPVKVQGQGAAEEISQAIDEMNHFQLADVIIVGRGGGSIEDLWAFNEPCVIESIHKSHIPVVSAIGHETDTTLADLVADLRAPTPSAAAELVLAEKQVADRFLSNTLTQINQFLRQALKTRREKLTALLNNPHLQSPQNMLRFFDQRVDEMQLLIERAWEGGLHRRKERLQRLWMRAQAISPESHIQKMGFRLKQIQEKFDYKMQANLQNFQRKFENVSIHLKAIDPKKVLDKGYSIVFDEKQNSAILSVQKISLKQRVKLILKDGYCEAVIDGVHQDNGRQRVKL